MGWEEGKSRQWYVGEVWIIFAEGCLLISLLVLLLFICCMIQGVGVMKENMRKEGMQMAWAIYYLLYDLLWKKKKKKALSIFTKNYIVLITYIPPWWNKTKARNQTHTHTTTNKNIQPNKKKWPPFSVWLLGTQRILKAHTSAFQGLTQWQKLTAKE